MHHLLIGLATGMLLLMLGLVMDVHPSNGMSDDYTVKSGDTNQ